MYAGILNTEKKNKDSNERQRVMLRRFLTTGQKSIGEKDKASSTRKSGMSGWSKSLLDNT